MTLEVDDPDPEPEDKDDDDKDDDPARRLIIGPFVKLLSKRDYSDYYLVIQTPICMNQISAKIKKNEYNRLSDLKTDIVTLCNNCRTYNDDSSLLYADANTMEDFFNNKLKEELIAHPELQELEDPSHKDTSAAASTSAGTPQPVPSALPKIRLVSNANGAGQVNGGGSSAQSDDD